MYVLTVVKFKLIYLKMPRSCCVPGCKSNYTSTLKAGGKLVSAFLFPKDETLKAKWLNAIPRSDWTPSKHSVVCCLHFPETDIIRDITETNLKPNVVPSIFPNLPKYLSKTIPTPRKNPEERFINENCAKNDFLKLINQKAIMCSLTLRSIEASIEQDNDLKEFYSQCFCGSQYKNILNMLCSIFSNILLNNYVKLKNNQAAAEKTESKNKKKKT
jgi:hypothetical protein